MRNDVPGWVEQQLAIAAAPQWLAWPRLLRYGAPLLSLFGRPSVTGSVPERLMAGPLLLAANHIGNADCFLIAIAARRLGMTPRFLIKRGITDAAIVGPLLTRAGHITVARNNTEARYAAQVTEVALAHSAHVMVFPEGRIGLDPEFWPEKGRSGLARLALRTGVPVIPISQWGAHEVTAYDGARTMIRTTISSAWRQPALQVHFGAAVPMTDLDIERRGDAWRMQQRINIAITEGLRPLRRNEPGLPRYHDPTRRILGSTAAYPGGITP